MLDFYNKTHLFAMEWATLLPQPHRGEKESAFWPKLLNNKMAES